MPVLGKLRGVECARCREAGHFCQAQIVIDEIALCLRCADREPCIYLIAKAEPERIQSDPCVIPKITREDRQAIREMPPLPSIYPMPGNTGKLDDATREEIVRLGKKYSAPQLAHKFGVSKTTIQKIKREHREKLRARLLAPVEQEIGGEAVSMAPFAVFGAEMLGARQDEPKK